MGIMSLFEVRLSALETVSLDGKANMVLPFARLKKRWHAFVDGYLDHSLHLGLDDPLIDYFKEKRQKGYPKFWLPLVIQRPKCCVLCWLLRVPSLLNRRRPTI